MFYIYLLLYKLPGYPNCPPLFECSEGQIELTNEKPEVEDFWNRVLNASTHSTTVAVTK